MHSRHALRATKASPAVKPRRRSSTCGRGARPLTGASCGAGLGALLETAKGEQLHAVLDAVASLVAAVPAAAPAWGGTLADRVLAVWRGNVEDPLVTQGALEVVSALADVPECLPPLQVRRPRRPCLPDTVRCLTVCTALLFGCAERESGLCTPVATSV